MQRMGSIEGSPMVSQPTPTYFTFKVQERDEVGLVVAQMSFLFALGYTGLITPSPCSESKQPVGGKPSALLQVP